MHNRKDPGQRLMRWMFKFIDYQYTFKYRPGKENVVADFLSRNPIVETPEAEINQRLPLLRVLMHGGKGAAPPKGNPRPKSKSPVPKTRSKRIQQPSKVTTRAARSGPEELSPAPDPEVSCVALRTRSHLPSVKTPALPSPPARIDTRLRKSRGKGSKTPKAQQSASPSEPSTSIAAQCSPTDWENSESEKPPLVDPRYSGLREETEPPTVGSTETEEEPEPSDAATQLEDQKPTSKSSPTLVPDIILTPAPTTDELATTEDANNKTEVVETGLSEDDLLKAAAELDISQRIIERRAYETENIIDEKDLELTIVVE
uniref:Reverse transcriptase RNase H-like domain-containing protein n=2 Tax=Trichogramma kaykai TaxID=54128 RepID=A0ABD2X0X4_9HYME